MFHHLFKLLLLSFFLVGCVVTEPSVSKTRITELSTLFQSLDKHISQEEATHLSQDIFYKTQKMTQAFKRTSSPRFHNFLVNVGYREKGLCYHWSDALYTYLSQKKYASFEFHLMGANIGEYWSEHNVLVVIEKGGEVEKGIVIDPWRDTGKLYFSKVNEDTPYQWKHRANRGCKRQ